MDKVYVVRHEINDWINTKVDIHVYKTLGGAIDAFRALAEDIEQEWRETYQDDIIVMDRSDTTFEVYIDGRYPTQSELVTVETHTLEA